MIEDLEYLRPRWSVEWGFRLVLAIIAGSLGYVAVVHALAAALQRDAPVKAHLLSPGNGAIAARLSAELSGMDATADDRIMADHLARRALLQDPTAVDAAATLGSDAAIRGDATSARRAFGYAEALSKRDARTQAWLIQDAVIRNDIPDAIRHYDILLRTSTAVSTVLFPALASAIIDPNVRSALVGALSNHPNWGNGFIDYLAGNGSDPQPTVALFRDLRRAGILVNDGDSALVISALVAAGDADDGWSYYQSVRPGADRRMSRDPRFNARLDRPAPFDWTPINEGGISTSIQQGDKGGVFVFQAPPSVGGVMLRQLQMLPAGEYVLDGRSEGIDQPVNSRPYWTLSCHSGRELGRIPLPNSTVWNGRFSGRFTVPADCPIQVLALNALPSNSISGVEGQIDWTILRPVR